MEQKHSIPAPGGRAFVVVKAVPLTNLISYMQERGHADLDALDIITAYGDGNAHTLLDKTDARDCITVNLYDAVEDLLDSQLDAELDAHLAALGF